jgi:hypothetical protein
MERAKEKGISRNQLVADAIELYKRANDLTGKGPK